ncbi:MAG: membrane dipeptidase, partial [Phenylobacterium sp.]
LAGLAKKMQAPGKRTEAEVVALTAERREIDARWPVPRATFDDFMKHVLHAIDVAGIDHVGMSGDFDGGGGLAGLEDITDYPKITAALLKAGYSKDDVAKFWGGNVLRVMREAQALAEKPQ